MKHQKELIYNVWVDETFENFMNFPQMDGYFCYVGLMLPEQAGGQLQAFWLALEHRLSAAVSGSYWISDYWRVQIDVFAETQ